MRRDSTDEQGDLAMTAQGPPRSFDEAALKERQVANGMQLCASSYEAGARWQWSKDQAEYAQLKRKAEELAEALEEITTQPLSMAYDPKTLEHSDWNWRCIADEALRRWRGSGD